MCWRHTGMRLRNDLGTAERVVSDMSRPPAVALVTGSSRGIGAQTVRLLAGAGHSVIVNYRQKRRRAELVVDEVRAAGGGSAVAIQADLTDEAAVSAMFADVRAQFGRLDVLVLNASGGMERGADPGYAMRLNRDAQLSGGTQRPRRR
jgi:3-oxoacyl-[acyl-carrier protein] reductase